MGYANELRAVGIDLPRDSGQAKTICPKCTPTRRNKRDRSLSVNIDTGQWTCHHCGDFGSVGNPKDGYGAAPPKREYRRPDYQPPAPPAGGLSVAEAYLTKERGIPLAVVRRNRIGLKRVFFPQLGEAGAEVSAVAFPYYRDGECINVKYRAPKKAFRMEKDAELCLYGLDDIPTDRPPTSCVWVEGEIDKLSVEAAGIKACVSVPNGGTLRADRAIHLEYVEAELDRLRAIPAHLIATDADAVGLALQKALIGYLGAENCAIVAWPEECKDANETLQRHGAARVRECIEAARPAPIPEVTRPYDLLEEMVDLWHNGIQSGASPGSAELAGYYNVPTGLWTLVTGIPGHGKSAFIDWIAVNLARSHDWRFAIFSPENQPLKKHLARIISLYTGKPYREGLHERLSLEELLDTMPWVQEHFAFLMPETRPTIDHILELATKARRVLHINGLIVDPWNEIDVPEDTRLNETQYTSVALSRLRDFARREDIHLWLVAHPTKLRKDADGNYPVPTPYDVSGSAHFRNKADFCLAVHRPDVQDKADSSVEIHIQKVRNQPEHGRPGRVILHRFALNGRYYDAERWNGGNPVDVDF